jgi:hypothetical protein
MLLLAAAYTGFDKQIYGANKSQTGSELLSTVRSYIGLAHNEAVLGACVPKLGRKGNPTRMI